MNNKFKVGDRVIAIRDWGVVSRGEIGTILDEDYIAPFVRWDEYSKYKNDACGLCERGHGHSVSSYDLELYVEEDEFNSVGEHNDNHSA